MAIKVNGTTVLNDSRALTNITSADAATVAALNTAGVGGGGTAPTTGTSYEIAWGAGTPELDEFTFYENDYSPTPGPSYASYNSAGGPLSFSFIATIDGSATFRTNFRTKTGNPAYCRVVKNGSQVQESLTVSSSAVNLDINSSFSKGDLLQVQIRAFSYGQDVGFNYVKVLSGTNARGALMFQ